MNTTYTTTDFVEAIRRELGKMQKKVAAGATEAEQRELATAQHNQYWLLVDAIHAIERGQQIQPKRMIEVLQELERLIAEAADYEKEVWSALIQAWKEHYSIPD